ncbi:hypothetical protein JW777_03590 [bacterium]|nr:hypothetical protein [bacterium]
MRHRTIRTIRILSGSGLALFMAGCCSMNQLQGQKFDQRTASSHLVPPPPAQVFSDGWVDTDFHNPIQAVLNIGTGIAHEIEMSRTRAKMDSAMGMVDIPAILEDETLERGAKTFGFRAVDETRDADFTFDIEIEKYGIQAKSWTSGVDFTMEVKVALIENAKHRQVWRRCFDEEIAVSSDLFGLPGAANNVITMVSLSRLTADEIADGLEKLAVRTSDRIITRLREDFSEKNR